MTLWLCERWLDSMKIAVIGPGALGTLFAASLAGDNTNEVWLLDHDPERAARITGNILLDFDDREIALNIPVTANPEHIGETDLVILCVKSMDVNSALQHASSLFTPDTLLIPFQNGIGHIDTISTSTIPSHIAFGVTSQGATLIAPGHVRHGGAGVTKIGFLKPADSRQQKKLHTAARILTASGFKTTSVPNILDHIWGKLLVNIGINALTVIYDCPNGELLNIPEARDTLVTAVQEGQNVAHTLGISFEQDPVELTLGVCHTTATNISSMLQDARKHRQTEIDAINGALVQKAKTVSIDVPVNTDLVAKVKQCEAKYLKQTGN